MKITMVGTGYVGLVSGTCFSETGTDVCCVDVDKNKIDMLKNGQIPIYEPGLNEMVQRNVEKGRLTFTTSLAEGIKESEVVFIAVGTPPDDDGSADLSYVLGVAREVGQLMESYLIIVDKSTVPVGTADKVRAAVQEELDKRGSKLTFDVVSNPEFLKEGQAINDFLKPDRIVVGTESEVAQKIMNRLYRPFVLNGHPVIFMDIKSAEMTKYAANAMLATKISFMNDIAKLCEIMGSDINMVRKGIGSDRRIGPYFIYPGTGYGGSCFPKDVKAIIKTAKENNHILRVLQAVEDVNDDQKHILPEKLKKYYNNDLQGKTITLWGLSFKPHTDDMREAPALVIIEDLLAAGCKVKVYDPVSMHETERRIGKVVTYCKDQYEALIDSDALLLVTEWPEFRDPNFTVMKKLMLRHVIFDGRNIFMASDVHEQGFEYHAIGIKTL